MVLVSTKSPIEHLLMSKMAIKEHLQIYTPASKEIKIGKRR
jgi:hypothetical protein